MATGISRRVLPVASAIVAVFTAFTGIANADSLVLPAANEMVEGSSRANSAPFNNASRYQQIFASSAFGATALRITELVFRPDSTQTTGFSNTLSNLRVDLSTTSVSVGGLNPAFASNVGANNTTVYNGPLTLTSANVAGPGNTKAFDITIPLTTPFDYNPAGGNLLMDFRNSGASNSGFVDLTDGGSPAVTRLVFSDSGPTATSGSIQAFGLPTRFTFTPIPEPASAGLLALAGLALLSRAARRRV